MEGSVDGPGQEVMQEEQAQVIMFADLVALDRRDVERVNGVRVPLGRLSLDELRQVEATTKERLEEVQTELQIVRDYIETFPGGDEDAS